MDSDLTYRYAFIEHMQPLPSEEEDEKEEVKSNSNLMRAQEAYKRELIKNKNMTDDEASVYIKKCDW
jgi:hypothetical protein